MIYVIGARGRLGQAITAEYADAVVVPLERAVYADWSRRDTSDAVTRYFDNKTHEGSVVFVASGLLDPRLPQDDLLNVNFHLPKNIIQGATRLGIKVVTFGTVMEGLLKSQNAYIQTKTALGDYVAEAASANHPAIHVRIHTLYGLGEPSPFMFLGQMLEAIRKDVSFDMTQGKQLREYHHLRDEAKAIRIIADLAPPGVITLSHGQPLSLKQIAESVFQSLDKSHLLRVGALPAPSEENYQQIFHRPDVVKHAAFRDSLPAVVAYMHESYLRTGTPNKNEERV
jgi:nucleoside-diphosphate-sugar epimerase